MICFSAGNRRIIPNKALRTVKFFTQRKVRAGKHSLECSLLLSVGNTAQPQSEHWRVHKQMFIQNKYLAIYKLLMSANNSYRTSSMSKVSLANSSISAAVPTNMRSSWDNWSRVISTPIGRSHLPTTSSSRKVWCRASVHTVSQIVESWFTKTLACLKDNKKMLYLQETDIIDTFRDCIHP